MRRSCRQCEEDWRRQVELFQFVISQKYDCRAAVEARERAVVMQYAPAFHLEPESKVWALDSGVQVVPVRVGLCNEEPIRVCWAWKCDNVECWGPHWGIEPGGCCLLYTSPSPRD